MTNKPPSFNEKTPTFTITRPDDKEKEKTTKEVDNGFVCSDCIADGVDQEDATFKTRGALGSHETYKHGEEAAKKEVNDMVDGVTVESVYQSDIIYMLIPNTTRRIYDRKNNCWVRAMEYHIPDEFILYKTLRNDVVHVVTDNVNHKKSFTEVLLLRKDKVIMGGE